MTPGECIWGSLLGDGYCNPRGCITLEHSVWSAPYLFWKWELLKRGGVLAPTSTPRLVARLHRRTSRWSYSLRFNTRTLYGEEREIFYRLRDKSGRAVKCAPPIESLRWTPGALAVGYMDDGGRGGKSKRGSVIDVSCWGTRGRKVLSEALNHHFHLETSFHGGQGGGVKLYIPDRFALRFRDLVAPYIIPAMYYKIAHLY